ncbi:hypothetical protein ABS71_04465 [bacterium SCN 62-11]|nr:MAG: hypothetical protein ABS71_04465 [bacterium SCN 62-11]
MHSAAWCAGGKYLLTTTAGRRLRLHGATTGKVRKSSVVPGKATVYVSFGPDSGTDEDNNLYVRGDGEGAITCGVDRMIHWWKLPQLTCTLEKDINYNLVGMSLVDHGRLMAYTSTSSRYLDSEMGLLRWDGKDLKYGSFSELPPPDGSSSYSAPQLSPDGLWAMAFTGQDVQLWDLSKPEAGGRHVKDVLATGMALTNQHFYTEVKEGVSVRSYAQPEQSLHTFPCRYVRAIGVDSLEQRLVVLTWDELSCWDLRQPEKKPRVWKHKSESLQLSPDGKKAILRDQKSIEVWDLEKHRRLYRWEAG